MKWALFTRNLKQEEKGATIIEFAIIAPILFLVLMGIVDVGLIFMGRTFLDSGAREAARFGITGQTQGAGSSHFRPARLRDVACAASGRTNQARI